MADPVFLTPNFEGAGLQPQVEDAFGSFSGAVTRVVDELNRKMRANKTVYIPEKGNVPLSRMWEEFGLQSGDVLLTTQSKARIMLRRGWVLMDGTNGTVNAQGRYGKGASSDGDVLTESGGGTHCHTVAAHDHAPTGEPSDCGTICFSAGCCSCDFATCDHTHDPAEDEPETDAVVPNPAHFFGWWIMKL